MINDSNLNLTEQQKGLRTLYISEWTELVHSEISFYRNILDSPLISPFFRMVLGSPKFQFLIKQRRHRGSLPSTIWNKEAFGQLYLQSWRDEVLNEIEPLVKGKITPIKGFLDNDSCVRWHLENIGNYRFWNATVGVPDVDVGVSFNYFIIENSLIFYRFFEAYLDVLKEALAKSGKLPGSFHGTNFYEKFKSFMDFHQIVRDLLIESKVAQQGWGMPTEPRKQIASRLAQILQDEFRKTIFDQNGNEVLVCRTVRMPDVRIDYDSSFSGTKPFIPDEDNIVYLPSLSEKLQEHNCQEWISNWLSSIT